MASTEEPSIASTPLEILYRDDELVIVNKPSGMLVHKGWANDNVVAMKILRNRLRQWVYPVHRLDRGTSGILVFALSSEIASELGQSFMNRSVRKEYLAIVRGVPEPAGLIEHPLAKTKGGEKKPARTRYERLASAGRYSLVRCIPETGRLHQIRRHLKHISCPIIGDVRYGKGVHNRHFRSEYDLHRLALHAASIELRHPRTRERLVTKAPLPPELLATTRALGFDA